MLKKSLFSIFLFTSLFSAWDEEQLVRRMRAHLLIDDPKSALRDAEGYLDVYPESQMLKVAYIEALAAAGREEKAVATYEAWSSLFKDEADRRQAMEAIGWGVLGKASESSQYSIRLSSIVGAFLTHDVRAVKLLLNMMRDSNAILRSVAVQLSCQMRDGPLQKEIIRLFEQEKVWIVRLEVIKALGIMGIREKADDLKAFISNEKVTFEEKGAAIGALVHLYDDVDLKEIEFLARSDRAAFRQLACGITSHFGVKEAKDIILPLIEDPSCDVRIAALNALGLCYRYHAEFDEIKEYIEKSLEDTDPAVAITAGWAALLLDPSYGEKTMEKWLENKYPENRRMAAAAIRAAGCHGVSLSMRHLKRSGDPYVRANLALGLIGQRVATSTCCNILYKFLMEEDGMWMWDSERNGLFQALAPSRIRHIDQIPHYPDAMDQLTRLNLLSLLAILEDSRALKGIKQFLQNRHWAVTGVAAATLLQVGDEGAIELVKELLDDPDRHIQIQAALVLAVYGKEASVLSFLEEVYDDCDHEMKMQITEAIGHIGTPESAAFLLKVMKEPFPILRVIAASSLIQCLNR